MPSAGGEVGCLELKARATISFQGSGEDSGGWRYWRGVKKEAQHFGRPAQRDKGRGCDELDVGAHSLRDRNVLGDKQLASI